MTEIMDGLSRDLEADEMEKLKSVFPQCFVEGRLDIDKLLNLCGQYIDDDFEKYEFKWKGKAESLKLAQRRSAATLRPCPEESVDFESTKNLYIEGDNLEVLKLLQAAYYRKVKMIYIDPPYNTGNDFIYEDDFKDTLARYKEVTSQTTKSNPESMGRFHTNWLNMMYPRLRLAANLLRDDGVIFISIDDHEVHNLRKLCDEVFGEENFVACIVWQKKFAPQNDDKYLSDAHDYILMYARSKDQVVNLKLTRSEQVNQRFSNPDDDPSGPWASTDLTRQEHRDNSVYPIISPSGKEWLPLPGTSWRHPQKEMEELIRSGQIWFGQDNNSKPRRKKYLADIGNEMVAMTFWTHSECGHNQEGTQSFKALIPSSEAEFSNPKPIRLIKRLLEMASKESGDLILDFFSGSSTTAEAVLQLNAEDNKNRRFIMVQLPELNQEKSINFKKQYNTIAEIGKERIRRAGRKILSEQSKGEPKLDFEGETKPDLDVGFKVFKLDSSNNQVWDTSPITSDQVPLLEERLNSMVERVKRDRTDLDMVYEIMLKLGIPLTESVTALDMDGKKIYSVREDSLILICLDKNITTETVEKMAALAPARIIFGQDCFPDVSALSNAKLSLRDAGIQFKFV
ncbi:site-specific DNA-methyltransferase [Deltaproteobacteria bacterium Smac51]|nr:site-specific DNA-methyltransferase [Deltaproteobacteria bacterium Smac51]